MSSLEKPSAGVGAVISTLIATSGTADYYLKTIDADFDTFSPDVEVTGDGDYSPKFENNGLLYADWRLNGAMVASQALGLFNIVDTNDNPTASNVTFVMGGTRKWRGRFLIRRMRVAWKRAGYFVGVSLMMRASDNTSGWATSDATSGVEAAV
jgi:hypothetical protein